MAAKPQKNGSEMKKRKSLPIQKPDGTVSNSKKPKLTPNPKKLNSNSSNIQSQFAKKPFESPAVDKERPNLKTDKVDDSKKLGRLRAKKWSGSKMIGHIQHIDMAYQFIKELGKYKIDILYAGSNHRFLGYLLEAAENGRIRVTSVSHFPIVRTTSIGGSTGLMLQAQCVHDNLMYMVNNSDAFIVLLGGYDTLNEIFNITSWVERDFHTKPIGLLNINNFFSDLLAFLDKGVDHKFISQPSRDILICADSFYKRWYERD
ncbi:hypothetical protein OROGR_025282 [Orobanche gracilis]